MAAPNEPKRVDAFTDVALDREEETVLRTAAAAFRKEARALSLRLGSPQQARQEFESVKARATDASPYLQFLLARAYLEGKGTAPDETLALEWMQRAAKNGSGDAQAWLDTASPRPTPAPRRNNPGPA